MEALIIILEVVLAFAAAVLGLYALAVLLERRSRFASRALASSVIAVVLAIASLICTLFFPAIKNEGKPSAAGSAQTTANTTTATASTTRMDTKPSTANNIGTVLANIPTDSEAAREALAQIQQLCTRCNGKLSFYYRDLDSGYELEYRADRAYQAASVIKAPYVKYLLSTGVDRTKVLTMNASDKQGGSGIVDQKPAGTTFTVGELMEYAIRYSDNTAYYLLNKEFGFSGFNAYAKELGISANGANNCTLSYPRPRFGYLSARDIGLYMADIAGFFESTDTGAQDLKVWMSTTAEERQLVDAFSEDNVLYGSEALKYNVAHKYGDTKNIENAFHDGAIVFADHPFVLAVASSLEPFAEDSIEIYHDLAFQVLKLHLAYYGTDLEYSGIEDVYE